MKAWGICAAAVLIGAAGFAGAPAGADTTTFHGQTITFHSAVPCVGAATITSVVNGNVHLSANPSGGTHENDNTVGTFTAALDAGGTSSGHYDIWSMYETADGVTYTASFIFNGQVTGGVGAGTSWHENFHTIAPVDPAGIPKLVFDDFHCG